MDTMTMGLASATAPSLRGLRQHGSVHVVAAPDKFKGTATAKAVAGLLGDRAKFDELETRNHVVEEGKERGAMLKGLEWLSR